MKDEFNSTWQRHKAGKCLSAQHCWYCKHEGTSSATILKVEPGQRLLKRDGVTKLYDVEKKK